MDAPMKYEKRPRIVEAMQLTRDNYDDVVDWLSEEGVDYNTTVFQDWIMIYEDGAELTVWRDYWVVREDDIFYAVHPTRFLKDFRRRMK